MRGVPSAENNDKIHRPNRYKYKYFIAISVRGTAELSFLSLYLSPADSGRSNTEYVYKVKVVKGKL